MMRERSVRLQEVLQLKLKLSNEGMLWLKESCWRFAFSSWP